MEVFYTFCTNIVDRIFGYFEYLLNCTGNNHILNVTTKVLSTTEIKPTDIIDIDKSETIQKIHGYTNNYDDDFGINNKFRKNQILQKNIGLEFANTESAYSCNDIIKQKKRMNTNGLYYGTFYENVVGRR